MELQVVLTSMTSRINQSTLNTVIVPKSQLEHQSQLEPVSSGDQIVAIAPEDPQNFTARRSMPGLAPGQIRRKPIPSRLQRVSRPAVLDLGAVKRSGSERTEEPEPSPQRRLLRSSRSPSVAPKATSAGFSTIPPSPSPASSTVALPPPLLT